MIDPPPIGSHGGDPVNCQGIVSFLCNNFRLGPLLSRDLLREYIVKDTAEEYYHFQRMERDNRGRPRENRGKGTTRDTVCPLIVPFSDEERAGGRYNARFEFSIHTQNRTFTSDS